MYTPTHHANGISAPFWLSFDFLGVFVCRRFVMSVSDTFKAREGSLFKVLCPNYTATVTWTPRKFRIFVRLVGLLFGSPAKHFDLMPRIVKYVL